MKRMAFFTLFITTHVLFAILHIHKNTQFIKQTFAKQKSDSNLEKLALKKQELTKKIYLCQNQESIKEYVDKQLHLQPLSIKQVKKLGSNDKPTI